LDEQIDQIKSILPTLGEGYIEEALKCYNHDVDQTLMALLESASEENSHNNKNKNNIHPRLLTIPTNLPRKLRSSVDKYSVNVSLHRGNNIQKHNDGKEFITLQKEYIKQNERIAEEESYLIEQISRDLVINESPSALPDTSSRNSILIGSDEYNDEYDDQYDGIGDAGGGGVADVGLYDVDNNDYNPYAVAQMQQQQYSRSGGGDGGRAYNNEQQMKMKKYNSLIKDITAEGEFWEGNRNTNRGGSINKATKQDGKGDEEEDDDGERNRFGLDKGRGGRVIGSDGKYLHNSNSHGRGGGRGRGGEGKGEVNTTSKTTGETDLSKVQKRKKNDNKSKIGNHHRKDRATKKASGGMII
jgi:hypothetical protein